jgi:hypothetical protein
MKRNVTWISLVLTGLLLMPALLVGQDRKADKDTGAWRYEIEPVGVGTQGTYLIKVWTYSKKSQVAIDQAKKNAIHGIIFRGFTGITGVPGQKALSREPNLEVTQGDFFKTFFAQGGDYMRFVSITNDGSIAPEDRLKVGNEYKIGVIVSVNVSELRKYLEDKGIIKKLGAGF